MIFDVTLKALIAVTAVAGQLNLNGIENTYFQAYPKDNPGSVQSIELIAANPQAPDQVMQSGTGFVMPEQNRPAVKPKRIKVSDLCKPGEPEYVIRQFENKTQKELFQSWQGIFSALKDPSIASAFSKKFAFYSLRYPVWPLARPVNAPLSNNNIFVLDGSGKIIALITSDAQMRKFFQANLKGVTSDALAKQVLLAWLHLSEALAQDGMFQFRIAEASLHITTRSGNIYASGQSQVEAQGGNQGFLESKLVFDRQGKLVSVEDKKSLQEGIRPICQSTKLLDADPIVRKMAEQDILVMGLSCKFYLDEQRAKASPELKAAIDAIWMRIEKRERCLP